MPHDLVIRGGMVVDGTGAPASIADVAIDGDLVVEVGRVEGTGQREIDAEGRVVTPGFVDIHTHLDAQLSWDPIGSSSCWHGVTSVVLGNCGVTFAPVAPGGREFLAEMMESVEDIPAECILGGLSWNWETYGEYLAEVALLPKGVNAGGMVGHCAVRVAAMGERSLDEDPATAEDIAAMVPMVDEALAAGALGFSTSRTFLHRCPTAAMCPAPTQPRTNSSPLQTRWATTAASSSAPPSWVAATIPRASSPVTRSACTATSADGATAR